MSPHQNGKVFGVLMALSSLVFIIPMALIFSMAPMPVDRYGHHMGPSLFMLLVMPILYLVFGYVFVAIWCLIYNFVAKHIGGIEFELESADE
jgi:hypothetical protein